MVFVQSEDQNRQIGRAARCTTEIVRMKPALDAGYAKACYYLASWMEGYPTVWVS